MAVRFVIGRAGSGKTTHCLRAIVEAVTADPLGPPIFWILPKQATLTAERQLVCETTLPAVCKVRVESFDGLSKAVLNDCGGAAVPLVTNVGRRLILAHLLRTLQPRLNYFASVAHHPGLASALDATFTEIEKSGRSTEEILSAIDAELTLSEIDDLLRPKLADLHLLYDAYTTYLGQDRLDPHRRNQQVVDCIAKSKLLRNATIFVDGFYDYSESERRIICGLAGICRGVDITVLADPASKIFEHHDRIPDEDGLFHRTETAYRRLRVALQKSGIAVESPVLLKQTSRFRLSSLRHIEADTFAVGAPVAVPSESDKSVTFAEADDRATEVDAAARHIISLLRSGHRMREIAVLVRDLEQYRDLIKTSFHEHGIAFFLDHRRMALHHPLLRTIRCLLDLSVNGWQGASLVSLIKSGLTGLTTDEADDVENYALEHRIRPSDWASTEPWVYRRNLTRGEEDESISAAPTRPARIDALRRKVVDVLRPFMTRFNGDQRQSVKDIIASLYAVVEGFGAATSIARWIAEANQTGQFEQAAEHQQVWTELMELLDQVVDLIGDQQLTPGEFSELFSVSLDSFDLALAPTTIDQVLVGSADRTRLPEVRTTLVLGLNDGEFPHTPREDSVLSDRDRSLLRKRDVDVSPETERQLLDERLLAYVALTSASESLYLSRVASDPKGEDLAPSPYWERMRLLIPDAPISRVTASTEDPQQIATPRQLVISLSQWARRRASNEPAQVNDETLAALYQWMANHPSDDTPISAARFRGWRALSYLNRASLRPETAARLFPDPLQATATQLETFAACPFKHFARFGLKLQERREDAFTGFDLSRVYHDVLERMVRQMLRTKKQWRDIDSEWTDGRLKAIAVEVGAELRKDLAIDPAQSRYLLQRIENTVRQIVLRQRAIGTKAQLSGGHVGVTFGTPDAPVGPLEIPTPKGRRAHLRGRIDRIDLLPDATSATVFDYKLAAGGLSPAMIYNGLSLQLLTYLLVLQANGHELTGAPLTPAAGFYLQLLRGMDTVHHPDEAVDISDPVFHHAPRPRGIFDSAHLRSFDPALAAGASDLWSVFITKEGTFGRIKSTDICTSEQLLNILAYVRGKLAGLTDAIIGGDISIRPYWLARKTPCSNCGMRPVCRFDVALNGYNVMHGIDREELLTLRVTHRDNAEGK